MAQGSIQKRTGKSGKVTWTCVVDAPPDPKTGKRRQRRLSADTKRELQDLVTQHLHAAKTGAYIAPTDLTVAQLLDRWFPVHAERVSPATTHRYRRAAETHIIPAMGAAKIARLTTIALQDFYRTLQGAGLTPEGVRMVHKVVHGALKQAVDWQYLPRNPSDGVSVPRATRREMAVWTTEHVARFLAATDDNPQWAAFYRVAIHTGMRRGELLALRWSDIDLDRGFATVRRTMTEDESGKPVIGTTSKTDTSRRTIALGASCTDALRHHKAKQSERRLLLGAGWVTSDGDLVFDRGEGGALHPDSVDTMFRRTVVRLGLPRIRVHDLRHTMATLALAEGLHPKVVQERLGHSSIAMTLDRYSHISTELQRDGAARLDAVIERASGDLRDQSVTKTGTDG
jgi:integrase